MPEETLQTVLGDALAGKFEEAGEISELTWEGLLCDPMKPVRAVFGLVNQGHIPTIEKMLDNHCGWDEINTAIGWAGNAAQESYIRYLRKRVEAPDKPNSSDLLCDPWPIKDVLSKLVEAANILLNEHDYDGHGWEEINIARDKAIEIIEST